MNRDTEKIDVDVVWYLLKEHCFNSNYPLNSITSINISDNIIYVKYSCNFKNTPWVTTCNFEIDMKEYLQKIREDKLSKLL